MVETPETYCHLASHPPTEERKAFKWLVLLIITMKTLSKAQSKKNKEQMGALNTSEENPSSSNQKLKVDKKGKRVRRRLLLIAKK